MRLTAGRKNIGVFVDRDVAERFETVARQTDGSVSAALRRMIGEAVDRSEDVATLPATGPGKQVNIRLRDAERQALAVAARDRGMTPASWLRSLALVHLLRRPRWNGTELAALHELTSDIRAIGNRVNQIARALNVAVQTGEYPPYQGGAAREGAILVRHEMRRLVAIMDGNYAYWGLPDAERPRAAPGAMARAKADADIVEQQRRLRPRRRPSGL